LHSSKATVEPEEEMREAESVISFYEPFTSDISSADQITFVAFQEDEQTALKHAAKFLRTI
jgi:hypothetical protein